MTYQDSYHKVIYLCRDGRDVAVSYYHFLSKLRGYEGDFNSFFLDYLLGNVPFGSWHRHVTQWIFEDPPQQLLVIKYEDTISSPRQILERIALFLQLDWSSETIQSAIDKSSFEKFQADYHRYKNETHWQKGFKGGVKGGPGKWRELFSLQQREKFWEIAGEVASRLGYSEI